jgi:hypothetical protein
VTLLHSLHSDFSKYLFLDFDGVLHPTTHGSLLFSNTHLLEHVFSKHQCSIVISSSWRFHYDLDEIKLRLPEVIRPLVIGVTGEAYIGQYSRYHEIVGYLHNKDKHFAEWKALDDSWIEFPEDCENLIRCNPNTGITDQEVKLLIDWLKK